MDYYQILGVKRNCDRDTLHRAFRELSRKQHPDRFDEDVRGDAEKKYQLIVVAFNTLKDAKQRAKYDKTLSQQHQAKSNIADAATLARRYYQTGLSRFQANDFPGAVEAFKRAVHYKEDAEYFFHKAQAEFHVPRLRKEAVSSIQKAIAKNSGVAKYHVLLVNLFTEFGLMSRARNSLEHALALFPNDEALHALVHKVHPEKTQKGGLFGGLFGKKKGG